MTAIAYWMPPTHLDRCARLADGLVSATAVVLPWSTSATGVFLVLWLIAVVPTVDVAQMRRVLVTPAAGIPVLLVIVALVGMLWAFDVSMQERLGGLTSFVRLLCIPLLIWQFHRSERAHWVLIGFLMSCGVLLALSWLVVLVPGLPKPWSPDQTVSRIPVKDYIAQSVEFTFCIFVLAALALKSWQDQRRLYAGVLLLLGAAFLVNVFYVSSSRTPLVVIPVLLLLFACRHLNRKGMAGALLGGVAVAAMAWSFAPLVKYNVEAVVTEIQQYRPEGSSTRAGERLEFWRKSIGFVADAPFIGHGTGSIRDQFRRSASGETGMAALASSNPHNQTLAVAIQLGLAGTSVLFALWIAHLLVFRGGGFAAWVGLVVVAQNIVSSLFNSHLFDFAQGWGYVIGVGVAAGVVLRQQGSLPPQATRVTS